MAFTSPPFGTCPCGGSYVAGSVDVTVTEDAAFGDLPRGECETCGSLVYKLRTIEELESTLAGWPMRTAPLVG